MRFLLFFTAMMALFSYVRAADWVVIVAGSNTYDNYRHQADACHAYQIVHKNGIPDSQIITMLYDDIANSPSNPFPGKIYNKPASTLAEAVDVYAGCKIDYKGQDVTAANFLNVLTGNSAAVPAGKPVLKSTANDRVFVNFVDHGATGIVAFPVGAFLYAKDLNDALNTMNTNKMFSKLVFYMEACESGSMFENILADNINVFATTASNAEESSYGTYCAPDDVVNGVSLNSCLGDLYSVNWMENTDAVGMSETLDKQFTIVRNETTESHVMEYGTTTFTSLPIGDFQGSMAMGAVYSAHRQRTELKGKSSTPISSRDITLHNKYNKYLRLSTSNAPTDIAQKALNELNSELAARKQADSIFDSLARQLAPQGDSSLLYSTPSANQIVSGTNCQKTLDQAIVDYCGGWTDYSLKYHRVIVNACGSTNSDQIAQMLNTIKSTCANQIQL